jgi:hypothetical protein
MSGFNLSAQDVHVEGTVLKARLSDTEGNWKDAELNLNDIIGNDDGRFEWGGSGMSSCPFLPPPHLKLSHKAD